MPPPGPPPGPHLLSELQRDISVERRLGVTEQLAVRRVHYGDAELDNVLLVVFFYEVGVFLDLAKKRQMTWLFNAIKREKKKEVYYDLKLLVDSGWTYPVGLCWQQNQRGGPGAWGKTATRQFIYDVIVTMYWQLLLIRLIMLNLLVHNLILGYYYRFTCFSPQNGFQYAHAELLLVWTLTFKMHKNNLYNTLKEREKKSIIGLL